MGGIDEILKARRAPAARTFRPRVIENLTPTPVYVESEAQHRELQKLAGATWIGSDGKKEAVEESKDRQADHARREREEQRQR